MAKVHHLANLLSIRPTQTAAEDGEVLSENEHLAAVDEAVARHHAVTQYLLLLHAEVRAPMHDEAADFDEAGRVEQEIDTLAGRELSPVVLLLDSLETPSLQGARVHVVQALDGRGRGDRRCGHGPVV